MKRVLSSWWGLTLIAVLFYGLWAFFPKLAVHYLPPRSALVYETLGIALLVPLTLLMVRFRPVVEGRGILFAMLTGIVGTIGTLFFMAALTKGKTAVVVTMTALYPVVAIILAYLFLRETVTVRQGVGIGLALLAIALLSF